MMKLTKTMTGLTVAAGLLLTISANAADKMSKMSKMGGMDMARYGGPVYTGAPALGVTSALVAAGGGAADFSTAKALTAIAGPKLLTAEVGKLTKQYGKKRVGQWLAVFDFAVADSLKEATAAGVSLPEPDPTLTGAKLGSTLVMAGLDKKNVFYTEYLLDKAVTHKIHMDVMDHIDAKFGAKADTDYHRITNQAMVDLAHALGAKQVKVAKLH